MKRDREFAFHLHEENLVHSELNFLKGYQWVVTAYAMALYGAIFGLTKPEHRIINPSLAVVLVLAVVATAVIVLLMLELAIGKARERSRVARSNIRRELNERPEPNDRLPDPVFLFLGAALVIGAAVIGYAVAGVL